ncbi:hypothetical protein TYRP_021309, partial [Tyrophagus putrescentiae]
MSAIEQLPGANDMYDDELDCVYEEGENEEVVVKEEEDSETDDRVLENVDQPAGNETVVKTEDHDETSIDMFDDEFHVAMERDFSAETNANGTNEAVSANEEHKTDSDATEIDEDHSAVSESQQNTEPVVSRSLNGASGEQQLNGRRRRAKSHKCQLCNKSFPTPSKLKTHQVVHTGIRAHQCPTCSKSFGQKNDLKRHQLIHTGIRAHKCTICSKWFSQRAHLAAHQSVHSDSRPFQCSTCEKTYKSRLGLKGHLQRLLSLSLAAKFFFHFSQFGKKMSDHEQQDETYDMYDEFDSKTVEVKEEKDSETDDDVLRGVYQPAGNETVIKTENQDKSAIDMFDDEFHVVMERDFSAETNANETSEAVRVKEEHEVDSIATENDEDDHSAVGESPQNTEPVGWTAGRPMMASQLQQRKVSSLKAKSVSSKQKSMKESQHS